MLAIKPLYSSTRVICSHQARHLLTKQISCQSTVVLTTNKHEKENLRVQHPLLDTKFDQYQVAYRYRRSIELLRGYMVYRLFSINFIVNNQIKLTEWSQRILGANLFKSILKLTTFGHFVGGETSKEIQPVVARLMEYGVRPILDYSVESDDSDNASSSSLEHSNRVHDFNTSKFIECIKTSRDLCGVNNFIAIKVTALIRPAILKKFNAWLTSIENRSSLPALFEFVNCDRDAEKTFQQSFESKISELQKHKPISVKFTKDELTELYNVLIRLNKIAKACVDHKISIMIDAEQSYFQTAIYYLVNELQRYYNRNNNALIYGTYQCYLKESLASVKQGLALAEKYNYVFATKLVRGAYMEQERRLARQHGYEDPINRSFEETSNMYHACLDEVLKSVGKREPGQVRVMVASHNEDTIRYAIQRMHDLNIGHDSSLISFASLYGMSDYVAFALANSGYKTYKYLPYGPMDSLQPYLFRRAQENRAVFQKAEKDRRLHFKAFWDRVLHLKI